MTFTLDQAAAAKRRSTAAAVGWSWKVGRRAARRIALTLGPGRRDLVIL